MTALDKYQRLEATGLWRQSPDDPGREVIMQFGKATLVLNASDDSPLAHWSIPAIEIVADDGETTVYALDSDGYETLTTSDRDMRAALSAILAGKSAATDPGPTRGGRILKALTALVAIAGLITFIPYVGALVGGALAIGLGLFQFWGDWLSLGLVAGVFIIGQVLEGNVLTPKLVGSSVGLHPVWLLLALSVFGVSLDRT